MAFHKWAFALLALFVTVTLGAEPLQFESRDGVLVLRNGFVLRGRITSQGETYVVTFDGKGEARLPRTEVEFECRNLDEAYLIKRDTLVTDDLRAHLALAEWCLRHGLVARAADQLLVVELFDGTHPAISGMERRLATLATPQRSSGHGKASAEQVASQDAPASATPSSKAVQEIEPMLMQQFTMTIQPILLNRCGTLSCHGAAGASNYRLLRPASGHAPTSRLTNRNLQATLAYVNRKQPEDSQLLSMAKQQHGGIATVVFHEKTGNQFELLTGWVRRLDESAPAATAMRRPATLPPSLTAKSATMQHSSRIPSGLAQPETIPQPDPRSAKQSQGQTPQNIPADGYVPRDPFDPEVFNRQFHKQPK